jgi:hypothetical protein
LDCHHIANLALITLVMGMHLAGTGNNLTIDWVFDASFNQYCDGFVHLIADDPAR